MHRILPVGALVFAIGCGSSFEGQVVDAMTNKPRGGLRLIAKALSPDVGMTCMTFEGTTDDAGNFSISGLCTGSTGYEITPVKETVWLADFNGVPEGGLQGSTTIQSWRAPTGDGIFSLVDDRLNALRTGGDFMTTISLEKGTDINYPSEIPEEVLVIEPGQYFVLAGADVINKTTIYPLFYAENIAVGTPEANQSISKWFAGKKFTGENEYEDVGSVAPDPAKTIKKETADRKVWYISPEALPAGRYGVYKDGDRRMYILDFQKPFVAPAAPAKEGEEKNE
ncbi:MAG: hypothetical protein HN348_11935 [Proteobacteria bacterium]|jgi:hypothetical protein|nr:hypothetical protein [Pseudomonadota bacterium]